MDAENVSHGGLKIQNVSGLPGPIPYVGDMHLSPPSHPQSLVSLTVQPCPALCLSVWSLCRRHMAHGGPGASHHSLELSVMLATWSPASSPALPNSVSLLCTSGQNKANTPPAAPRSPGNVSPSSSFCAPTYPPLRPDRTACHFPDTPSSCTAVISLMPFPRQWCSSTPNQPDHFFFLMRITFVPYRKEFLVRQAGRKV